ncbi:hypothetical protein DFH28DRAFT_1110827 [Melampsora americana]|nr:hypothetical protein DFH28DRAFT_1110827 [Melampsora americana]
MFYIGLKPKIDWITAQGPNHEEDQIYHTPYTVTNLKDFEIPYSDTFLENQPLHEFDFTNHLWDYFNDDHHASIDNLFSTSHNPEIDESQHKDASQIYSSDTQWLEDFRQESDNFKSSSMWEPHNQMEQPRTISPRLNSFPENHIESGYNGLLQPQHFHHPGTDIPQLFHEIPNWEDSLMHIVGYPDVTSILQQDMIQSHSINNHLNPTLPNPVGSEGSSHNTGMGGNPAYMTLPYVIETQKNDNTIPCPTFQEMGLNHIECIENDGSHCPPRPGWQSNTLNQDRQDIVALSSLSALGPDNLHSMRSKNDQKDAKGSKRKRPLAQSRGGSKVKTSRIECLKPINDGSSDSRGFDIHHKDSLESEVCDTRFAPKLMRSIRKFCESNALSPRIYTTEGLSFLQEIQILIMRMTHKKNLTDNRDMWTNIEWADKVLTVPFIGILLILHPEASSERHSQDELIQDGIKYMQQNLSELYMAGLKPPLKAWKDLDHKHFDISKPSALLHYTKILNRPDRIKMGVLWKLWQRWYRRSNYQSKTMVLGFTNFSKLIHRNIMILNSSTGDSKLEPPLEDFKLDHSNNILHEQFGMGTKLTWRDVYRQAINIGKEHYDKLTLHMEADEFFDQFDEALKSKLLSKDGKIDSGCIKRVDELVRKVYYELTPSFFGSLVALNSKSENTQSLEKLIDDGWIFFRNFLNLLQRTFPPNGSELEGVEAMEKEAVHLTLMFFESSTRTSIFSVEIIIALLHALLNQSSYLNKSTVRNAVNGSTLVKMIQSQHQFCRDEIR